jgi:hypothetical protein
MDNRSKLMQINSRDRTSGTNSAFTCSFGRDSINTVYAVALKEVQLTNSFYNIDEYNNTFYFDRGSVELSIVVPVGQYSITTFLAALTTQFAALAGPIVMTPTVTALTSKLNFATDLSVQYYEYRANGLRNPMASVLGLVGDNGSEVTSFDATGLYDLSGVKSIYVISPQLSGGAGLSSRGSGSHVSLVDVIPITVPYKSIQNHQSGDLGSDNHTYDDVFTNNLSDIYIELRDANNNLLDTNGHEVVLILKAFY